MEKEGKTVLVFGVFDNLHDGHRYFLSEARKHGTYLIVAAPLDDAVQLLKGHKPRQSFEERKAGLQNLEIVDEIVEGDDKQGSWEVLEKIKPDVVVLGYDQNKLYEALLHYIEGRQVKRVQVVMVSAYHPDLFHSSKIKD